MTDQPNDRAVEAADIYYEPQERAMAPGIVKSWPDVISHPTDPNGRLRRVERPTLPPCPWEGPFEWRTGIGPTYGIYTFMGRKILSVENHAQATYLCELLNSVRGGGYTPPKVAENLRYNCCGLPMNFGHHPRCDGAVDEDDPTPKKGEEMKDKIKKLLEAKYGKVIVGDLVKAGIIKEGGHTAPIDRAPSVRAATIIDRHLAERDAEMAEQIAKGLVKKYVYRNALGGYEFALSAGNEDYITQVLTAAIRDAMEGDK